MMSEETSLRQKFEALYQVALFRPKLAVAILLLSLVVGALEGIGLGFVLPIIEVARGNASDPSGPVLIFVELYSLVGVPFTLEYIIAGVTSVIAVRYASDFLKGWLTAILRVNYVRYLRIEAFNSALDARVEYFDQEGSDEILNAIVTQTQYAARTIREVVRIMELALISAAYVLVALYFAPYLMLVSAVGVGIVIYGARYGFESGFSVGDRVAEANEHVQVAVQAGTQGIRDVKLFGLSEKFSEDFRDAVDQYTEALVTQKRNQRAIRNINDFATAAVVFLLVYIGLEFSALTLGGLGVFLFAIFRLGPKVSNLNDLVYQLENDLPHLIRMQAFIKHIRGYEESSGTESVPGPLDRFEFDDVEFAYDTSDEQVLSGVSFAVDREEFVAFAGPSGAGKSTIVSLLAKMYEPDKGQILADGTPIPEFRIDEWRERISVVPQNPFIFNDTLRFNIKLDNEHVSDEEIERVCEIAQVTEFLDELPNGYDTILGDDGVRLSGGQKQRVAIARALLKDADLLILDEATSDLDSHLERDVHRGIESMERDYGIIAIAHRLSTITDADTIYMMEDGEIVECGRHPELVEEEGKYAALYATQSQTA